jgi:catechol 2,3-dioxygenase-like lactoylglutathione lyase family enzyme/predicted ester cyclase
MRTLHVGLRVADLERSLRFYTSLGYEVIGEVPQTGFGSLTMLKLSGDEFISLELVHDTARGHVDPGGLNHLVIKVEAMRETIAHLASHRIDTETPSSPDGSEDFLTAWLTDPDGSRIELVQWPAGHPEGMTTTDLNAPDAATQDTVSGRSAREVVEELLRRQQAGGDPDLDDLVAPDMVNHAAGPQGREGLKRILSTIDADLGPITVEQHHLIAEGDLVAQHLTLHGTHRASTMPLLTGATVSGRSTAWRFIHIWRVTDGMIVEHWACRDDMGLLEQLRT